MNQLLAFRRIAAGIRNLPVEAPLNIRHLFTSLAGSVPDLKVKVTVFRAYTLFEQLSLRHG
jgi:hypothetical protein